MLLFAILGAMTVVMLVLLVLPLLRQGEALTPRAAYDLEIYRDQLGELERDVEQGVIGPGQAELARTEIERRMLKASPPETEATEETAPGNRRLITAFAIVLALPLAAGGLYLRLGEPGVESVPFAQRPVPGQSSLAGGEDAPDMDSPEIESMVVRLAQRLENAPDDLEGWLMLARSYGFLERYDEAVIAYRHAAALADNDPAVLASLAESQVYAAGGMVTPAALETFARVIEMDPGNPAALFYRGLGLAQAGDIEGALERWVALGRETPADAPWLPGLRLQIEEAARTAGLDAASYLAALPEPAEAAPEPGQADMDAAGEMSPEEQRAMIRSMVERLAGRLADEPGDLEGWLRLARAYGVLGETVAASDAWARAAGLAPGDARVLESYAIALVETAPRNEPLTPAVVGAFERLAGVDPENPVALWHLGRAAAEKGDPAAARGYWQRLLARLPPGSDQHAAVSEAIDGLGEAPPGG